MQKFASALLAAVAAATSPASAEGWYARADLGYGFSGALETPREIGIAPTFGGDGDFDNGWTASVAGGRAFASGLRIEGELAYRDAEIERSVGVAPGAEANAISLLANAYYDFNRAGQFQPYVGAGVGVAQIDGRTFNNATLAANLVGFDSTDTNIAYQVLAGVGVGLSERVTLDVGYRYFAAPDLEFSGHSPLGVSRTFEADYEHHAATIGLRWGL